MVFLGSTCSVRRFHAATFHNGSIIVVMKARTETGQIVVFSRDGHNVVEIAGVKEVFTAAMSFASPDHYIQYLTHAIPRTVPMKLSGFVAEQCSRVRYAFCR